MILIAKLKVSRLPNSRMNSDLYLPSARLLLSTHPSLARASSSARYVSSDSLATGRDEVVVSIVDRLFSMLALERCE